MFDLEDKKIEQLWLGSRSVEILWKIIGGKAVKIYEAIRSCFGSGRWIEEKPWRDDEKWKDNK